MRPVAAIALLVLCSCATVEQKPEGLIQASIIGHRSEMSADGELRYWLSLRWRDEERDLTITVEAKVGAREWLLFHNRATVCFGPNLGRLVVCPAEPSKRPGAPTLRGRPAGIVS